MSYELLALDLDGTLTNSRKEITPATRQALIEIQEAGKKIVLASGRPDSGVLPLARELCMDQYGSYILTFNGARIRQCGTGELIFNATLPPEVVRPIYEIVREYPDVDIVSDTDDKLYSGIQANEYTELESRIIFLPITHVDNFPDFIQFPINALLVPGRADVLVTLEEHLKREFPDILNIYRSDPFFLEILPQDIDKAYSLQTLLKHLNLTADQMICCGDGYNDITMLQAAGLGVAMGNAVEELKEAADYITKTNDEDGVLHVIDQFLRD